jgi:hypothetical protein
MDARVLLVSDAGVDYARTYAVNEPVDEGDDGDGAQHLSGGAHPRKTVPLATIPARRDNAFCFLSPCGSYVAVITSTFATEDMQSGCTEKLSVSMHAADSAAPLYRIASNLSVSGDVRPGNLRSLGVEGVLARGDYSESFFNDASSDPEQLCDTFVVPMSDEELPMVLAVRTGEILCMPPLESRTIESIAGRPDVAPYRFSLNESLFLTLFATQSGDGRIQVFDCIAKRKLICSMQTPSTHRWRCEAHASGYIYVENNCACCSTAVMLPAPHTTGDPAAGEAAEQLLSPQEQA